MAAVSIRDLDDHVHDRLRRRAARHGRSMEAEMRAILTAAVAELDGPVDLFAALRERFAQLGGIELGEVPRESAPRAAELAE